METEANFILLDRWVEDIVSLIDDQSTDFFFRLLPTDRFILYHHYHGHDSPKRSYRVRFDPADLHDDDGVGDSVRGSFWLFDRSA